METIPITSLAPQTSPPADKSIRGIVTLSWPYSSSTRQCAFLLADPDFRLRSRKGQVRARFTGASAEAIAKARVGIGDEIVLSLNGASWEEDPEATRTPGKSVDGELFFRRKLRLKILRVDGAVEINVDAPASPPPRSPKKAQELATPRPKAVGDLRSGLDGTVESLPSYTYTSPAFVKRLRLSGESFLDSAFDPFTGGDVDSKQDGSEQRTSFGTGVRWRYADKTPSPKKDTAVVEESTVGREQAGKVVREPEDREKMLPPPLPSLHLPSSAPPLADRRASGRKDGPSTPKLQPVRSPTLPLPSPFPIGGKPAQFGLPSVMPGQPDQEQISPVHDDVRDDEDEQMLDQDAGEPEALGDHVSTGKGIEVEAERNEEAVAQRDEIVIENDIVRLDDDEDMLDEPAAVVHEGEVERTMGKKVAPPSDVESGDEFNDQVHHAIDAEQLSQAENESSESDGEEVELLKPPISEPPQTPTKAAGDVLRSDFGLDGTTSAAPSVQVTPQSREKDRIMAQTYRSLFGFTTSPQESSPLSSPPAQLELERPTSKAGLSDMARARLEAAGIPTEREQKPIPEIVATERISESEEATAVEMPAILSATSPKPPPSSARHSQVEVIELGSSSEEEDDDEVDEDEDQTPKAVEAEAQALRPQFASPEIQDSLEDSKAEDLLQPKHPVREGTPRHEQLPERNDVQDVGRMVDHTTRSPIGSLAPHDVTVETTKFTESQEEVMDYDHIPGHAELDTPAADSTSLQVEAPETSYSPADDMVLDAEHGEHAPLLKDTKPPSPDHMPMDDQVLDTNAAPPQSTAATIVIDLMSSSPIEQAVSSPAEVKSNDNDILEDFIEPGMLGETATALRSEDERQAEMKSAIPVIKVTTERSPAQSQNQDMQAQPQTVQAPSYPSLPLSPSNSQSLQEMPFQTALESVLQGTVRSVLPPTPQLTQIESSTQLQDQVAEEPPASQEMEIDETGLIQRSAIEDAKAFHDEPKDVFVESQELVEEQVPKSEMRIPARKSLGARLSNVPDVISAWFSPRRSSGVALKNAEQGDAQYQIDVGPDRPEMQQANGTAHTLAKGQALARHDHANGFSTALSYFTPLSRLEELLNPSSQQSFGHSTVDVFAVVTDHTKEPVRAKAGPRDYFTIFRISDTSLQSQTSVRVEVFRPWMATLPVAQTGDVVLLRDFIVKSRKRHAYLLSTDASAWCVWRYQNGKAGAEGSTKPVWARKAGSADRNAVHEEIKGPPVELGEQEREHARHLRLWWELVHGKAESEEVNDTSDDAAVNDHVSQPVTITAKL